MKILSVLILVIFLSSCGNEKPAEVAKSVQGDKSPDVSMATSVPPQNDTGHYREGELLVKFASGALTTSILRTHQSLGASVIRRFQHVPRLERIRLPQDITVMDAVLRYMSDPNVEYAEPNYIRRRASTVPDDPFFGLQWALDNPLTPGADIHAPEAWDISTGNSTFIAAFIDTGMNYTHPDLSDNIWINPGEIPDNGVDEDGNGHIDDVHGWNFVSNNNITFDDNGHGTHVAGIAGAVGNNGIGVSGMLWTMQLMPLKILNADGIGTVADEVAAIQYAIDKKVDILNASLTGSFFSNAEFDAINLAAHAGILFTAAAGNGGVDLIGDNNDIFPRYPASYNLSNIISVATTDQDDLRTIFSNYGPSTVHVAAPGVDILSTFPTTLVPSGYFYLSGTSQSTTYVTGLAGLLSSVYPHFTSSQIRGTILRSADLLPSLQGLIMTGGRINAYRALSSLLPPSALSAIIKSSSQGRLDMESLGQVGLSWIDNATGEDGYIIERKTGTEPYTIIATLGAGSQSYTDISVIDGTQYTYRVKAFTSLPNPPGTGTVRAESLSIEASVSSPLSAPSDLQATALSSSQVSLLWSDNSDSEDGFKIERKIAGGTYEQIAVTVPNETGFTDSGLSPSTGYTYRVRAFNSVAGESLHSNEASATTPAVSDGPGSGERRSSGGGGCSLHRGPDSRTQASDIILFLLPLIIIVIGKLRRSGYL